MPSEPDSGAMVIYLTDLPRIDEVARYAELGAAVVVAPFTPIPDALMRAAAEAGVQLVDWARRNAYRSPRPQWTPVSVSDQIHVYRRGDHQRYVLVDRDEAGIRLEDIVDEVVRAAGPGAITARGRGWFEVEDQVVPKVPAAIACVLAEAQPTNRG